ncbi:hypothetical protein CQ12_10035 [Bradyrhizobium jicamae]|uniref:Uncharacterized protein n=1 Tax=Bradyrhizobium jicamae TaxID=280332 RepID=A0A0R3LXN3_9BRAD|nr:hypothetical protein CQ12_10035 [Bradyrhizobium jicamae]
MGARAVHSAEFAGLQSADARLGHHLIKPCMLTPVVMRWRSDGRGLRTPANAFRRSRHAAAHTNLLGKKMTAVPGRPRSL